MTARAQTASVAPVVPVALPAYYTDDSVKPAYYEDAREQRAQFRDWTSQRQRLFGNAGGPAPTEAGGLPDGWVTFGGPLALTDFTHMYLLRLPHPEVSAGYWASAWFDIPSSFTTVRRMDSTPLGLLRWYEPEAVPDGATGDKNRTRIHQWMVHLMAGLYDANDPCEAAEQTLFLLSGHMRTPPVAATRPL